MTKALRNCFLCCAVFLAGAIPSAPAPAQEGTLVVFAAASLKNALDAVNAQWQKETGKQAKISYAASSALARQIEQGAPAQMFVSADIEWMNYLAQKNLIKADTRSNLLGNRLVIVAPKDRAQPFEIKRGFDLGKALGNGRLAVANVDAVPAGRYGKVALTTLGLWDSVANRTAQAENVRAALIFVSRGEAPLGIVYQTDAASDPNVAVVATFAEDTHPPIIYPIALTTAPGHPDAAAFLAFIRSGAAKSVFEAHGFTVLSPGRS
jgi:molybdate transport system substrate-binding protein